MDELVERAGKDAAAGASSKFLLEHLPFQSLDMFFFHLSQAMCWFVLILSLQLPQALASSSCAGKLPFASHALRNARCGRLWMFQHCMGNHAAELYASLNMSQTKQQAPVRIPPTPMPPPTSTSRCNFTDFAELMFFLRTIPFWNGMSELIDGVVSDGDIEPVVGQVDPVADWIICQWWPHWPLRIQSEQMQHASLPCTLQMMLTFKKMNVGEDWHRLTHGTPPTWKQLKLETSKLADLSAVKSGISCT